MKYVDEFRDRRAVAALAERIKQTVSRPWTIMEVCGGQTHAIVRFGLDSLLPKGLTLVHGPGCPVCVTPVSLIDDAVRLARQPGVILCSFGDMLRVPGSQGDLFGAKAEGADVRIIYSPLDALTLMVVMGATSCYVGHYVFTGFTFLSVSALIACDCSL
jgi:hydrogenase expression/formation protein HypD